MFHHALSWGIKKTARGYDIYQIKSGSTVAIPHQNPYFFQPKRLNVTFHWLFLTCSTFIQQGQPWLFASPAKYRSLLTCRHLSTKEQHYHRATGQHMPLQIVEDVSLLLRLLLHIFNLTPYVGRAVVFGIPPSSSFPCIAPLFLNTR